MKVLLVDGYNMLYRARSGWAKGDNPIVYTFFRSFRAAVNKFKPDRVYFVLEGKPIKRLAMMKEYKAQRVYHDKDDFHRQKRLVIKTLKEMLPVHVVRHPYYECDDVLAELASVTHKSDECIVVSSDTDFYQLLQTHKSLKLYNPIRKKFIEPPECDYVSWKALRGDSSDNIEGFRGIGDKRAAALLENTTSLQEFLSQGDNQEKFDKNCEMIRFHNLGTDLEDIERSAVDFKSDMLKETFNNMEFFSITNDKFWPKFVETFDNLS